jgi:hypothetical protein
LLKQQPVAEAHVNRHRASEGPQHEPAGNRQHVDNDDVLERDRVEREQHDVRQGDDPERGVDPERRENRGGAQRHRRSGGCGRADGARRDWAAGLDRMLPIGLAIANVVDEIDDPRERAEDEKRARRP